MNGQKEIRWAYDPTGTHAISFYDKNMCLLISANDMANAQLIYAINRVLPFPRVPPVEFKRTFFTIDGGPESGSDIDLEMHVSVGPNQFVSRPVEIGTRETYGAFYNGLDWTIDQGHLSFSRLSIE